MLVAWLGPWQFAIIVLLLIFFFGGKKFAASLRSLKRGGQEFKHAITEAEGPRDERVEDEPRRMKIG